MMTLSRNDLAVLRHMALARAGTPRPQKDGKTAKEEAWKISVGIFTLTN